MGQTLAGEGEGGVWLARLILAITHTAWQHCKKALDHFDFTEITLWIATCFHDPIKI